MNRFLLFLATCIFFTAACKKSSERDLEKEEDALTGQWTVASIRYVVHDSLGNTLTDSTAANQGTLEFKMASQEDADVFNHALFEGACANTDLVGYFRGKAAGDATTGGGWALYWDADPAGKRLIIWGIAPSSSYHRTVNFEYDGKGKSERTLWYTYASASSPNKRQFIYYNLRK